MGIAMKTIANVIMLVLLLPLSPAAQTDDTWPSLGYLRSDYRSVRVVAHVRIRESEIVNRIPGYDNWKIVAEVIEPFKGKFRKGEVIEYFHGAEAPSKKEFFTGEKIVFMINHDQARENQCKRRPPRSNNPPGSANNPMTTVYSQMSGSRIKYDRIRLSQPYSASGIACGLGRGVDTAAAPVAPSST